MFPERRPQWGARFVPERRLPRGLALLPLCGLAPLGQLRAVGVFSLAEVIWLVGLGYFRGRLLRGHRF